MMGQITLTFMNCVLVAATLFLFHRLFRRLRQGRVRLPLPPGPRGLPLIGNLGSPLGPAWITYQEWSKTYNSDILRLNVLGSNIIILNRVEAAVDLLEKRSAIYSDRPDSGITMLKELCGLGWSFGLQPYGPQWRDGRKAFQHEFNSDAVKQYRDIETRHINKLLNRILQDPGSFWAHTQNMVSGQILAIAYGIEIQDKDDPYVTTAERAAEAVIATLNPGSYLVDIFPFLKYVPEWVPGAGFKTQARIWRKYVMDVRDKPFAVLKERMEEDSATTPVSAARSLMENFISTSKDPNYMEEVVKSAVGSMYFAGSDTVLSIIRSFFLAMVLYPDICHVAQESVDRVCNHRLPDFSDYDSLPYVHALVKECLRWNPVAALNLAHRCTKDDIYGQYLIPEGSTILVNIWAILHDPTVYHDPEQFNPGRFLKQSFPGDLRFELDTNIRDPMDVAFGFGRRICPGRYMAYESLWLSIASVLAVFNIDSAKDENGLYITPSGEYSFGFACHPKPFVCSISPRSDVHEALILEVAMPESS